MRLPSSSLGSAAVRLESSIEVTVLLDAESLSEVFLNGSLQPAVRTEESKEPALRIEEVFHRLTSLEGDSP